jgi:hypothetical protein
MFADGVARDPGVRICGGGWQEPYAIEKRGTTWVTSSLDRDQMGSVTRGTSGVSGKDRQRLA